MSLFVKAYVLESTCQIGTVAEIRRFAVERNVDLTYHSFQNKVAIAFPCLFGKKFEIYWKDNEDDYIHMSSNEELMLALTGVQDLFKVYIQVENATSFNPEHEKKHFNVICDVCNGDVVGTRFKCMICLDYDLCQKCERKGNHSDHHMVRITDPNKPWSRWHNFGGFGNPGFQSAQFGGCFAPPSANNCPPFHHIFNRSNSQNNSEKKSEGNNTSENNDTSAEYLKHMGEHVAEMLNPFGINVDVHVDHNGKVETVSSTNQKKQKSMETENLNTGGDVPMEPSDSNSTPPSSAPQPHVVNEPIPPNEQTSQATAENGWTMLNSSGQSVAYSTAQSPNINQGQHSNTKPTEAKIAHALAQMKTMGFSDEGGWLTRLLEAKNGNISLVLDSLQPHNK